jgi:hypothetical protein
MIRSKKTIASALLLSLYFLGICSYPILRMAKRHVIHADSDPASRYTFDKAGRLASDDQKFAIPCPRQTDRTAVLLLFGQSNAGNHGGQRFHSEHGDKVVNFFNGQCFAAASPLLGSDGTRGEYWTQLGNLLIDDGAYDQVVLAPVSISGSQISRWSPGGDLNGIMVGTATQLRQNNYHITQAIWDQGEMDYVIGTSEITYYREFISLVGSLRDQVTAPIFVTVASKCLEAENGGTRYHSADNPIARAQLALPITQKGIKTGVNTDALLDSFDRYDDCHISASGSHKTAKAWAALIEADGRGGDSGIARRVSQRSTFLLSR